MQSILIIDDDEDIVSSLSLILQSHDYWVEALSETTELLQRVTEINPQLIILDIIFPDDAQAGFKAARMLQGSEQHRNIPVILLSAVNQQSQLGFSFSEKDISDNFMPVGAFLEKPVEPETLIAKIREFLPE